MILERAELPVSAGQEEKFEEQFGTAGAYLRGAQGCRGVSLARGVESPSKYLLLIEWDSIESHQAFTRTDEFSKFRALAGPFFAGKPAMEHFEPIRKL